MRKAIAESINGYLSDSLDGSPAADDARIEKFRSRTVILANECGCAMGGAFLTVTAVAAALYVFAFGHLSLAAAVIAVSVTLASAIVGKAVGIGTASARLLLLRRQLRMTRDLR